MGAEVGGISTSLSGRLGVRRFCIPADSGGNSFPPKPIGVAKATEWEADRNHLSP